MEVPSAHGTHLASVIVPCYNQLTYTRLCVAALLRHTRLPWRLVGFCLLLNRQVFEAVGGLDERFGLGLFDDDDLSLWVTRAGSKLAVAYDLFVHHFGSRTFAGRELDGAALLRENRERFAAKWGEGGEETHEGRETGSEQEGSAGESGTLASGGLVRNGEA